MVKVITIPKELIREGEVVIIPRKEYEEFSRWKASIKMLKTFTPTSEQKKDLKNARVDIKKKLK